MILSNWHTLSDKDKRDMIKHHGKCLNWQGMADSLAYIDAVVAYIWKVKYQDRLPRFGMKAAAEYLRWQSKAEDGSTLFKVNNTLTADINHWLLRAFPELEGFLTARYKA